MDDQTAREMARDLVRGSIIEDAAAQFIAQVLKAANAMRDLATAYLALTAERDALAEKLANAVDAAEQLASDAVPCVCNYCLEARATLAELKKQDNGE